MRTFIFFISLIIILPSSGHLFAQMTDLGYTDTRRNRESFKRLQPKSLRTEVATFALSGISESVGTTPLQKISYTEFGNDFMNFEGEGIKASVKTAPFSEEGRRLDYDDKYLIRIDRKPYYGNYGFVPKTYISDVTLIIDGDTIVVPPVAYSDLYNLNLTYSDKGVRKTTNAIYKSPDGNRIYFYLFSRDNSGSYEVTWIFDNKQYARRVLDYGFM
ncbi:MAG: hypothetical protein ABIN48_05245 [Ginsengibacter sp.]